MDECADTLLALWEAQGAQEAQEEALEHDDGECAPVAEAAMNISGIHGVSGPASASRTAPGRCEVGEQGWRHEYARLFTKEAATRLEGSA